MSHATRGLTLIELMLVLLCLFLLLNPAFRILRSGTQSSLKGMMQIGTTLEARNVLRQVVNDLRVSAYRVDGNQQLKISWATLLQVSGALPEPEYSFLAFPFTDSIEAAIDKGGSGMAWRNASLITYRVEPHPTRPFMRQLVRVEEFHPSHPAHARYPGGKREAVLSDHVNLFEIKPLVISSSGKSLVAFRIHLQLVDFLPGRETTVAVGSSNLTRPREGAIADYFEIVVSEFYRAMRHKAKFNPNWQNGIHGPRG
ncbi:MAG: hypothetical protein OZSIB_1768 [Candidatus Ozemobacter sibiricus]|jgi:hypothetical protein|uniref:Uncharacterized protein n=1 Tax=Candidatus Ozemobacter sibiricus TaxID=2268124 RepID=A0A367ZK51_9BACT|nr:MAG: hypothetical protein OZSIB_1768 [Candidatus Ozemobacter sibiricus]